MLVAAAAVAASGGNTNLLLRCGAAACGAVIGDNLAYAIGRAVGLERFGWMRRPRIAAAVARVQQALRRRGMLLILAARYVPVGRVAVNMSAGALRYRWRRFLPLSIVGGVTWTAYSVGLDLVAGSWLGDQPLLSAGVGVARNPRRPLHRPRGGSASAWSCGCGGQTEGAAHPSVTCVGGRGYAETPSTGGPMPDLPVYRAPMRSRDDGVPIGDAVERALTRGICGMGARVERTREGDDAVRAHERLARRIARFAAAPREAPTWTRDIDGLWWLGRLDGDLIEDTSPEARRMDLVFVRPCRWLAAPIAPTDVPTPVSAAFARGGLNWQQVRGADISGQTDRIWDRYEV